MPKKVVKQPPDLKCPDCSGKNIISKGIEWYCKDCGRWWLKKYRNLAGTISLENLYKDTHHKGKVITLK